MELEYEFRSMSDDELDNIRLKAYLSFDEMNSDIDTVTEYYYLNSKGYKVKCNIICERNNNEVVIKNENGCQLLINKTKLFKI